MPWSKIRGIVAQLDVEISKTGIRIDTAKNRQDQLSWANHKEWYQKRVRKVRSFHRRLKQSLSRNGELSELLEDMQDPLSTVCDIDSTTTAKFQTFQELKEKWDGFQVALDNEVRSEHDIFLQRDVSPEPDLCFVLMPFDKKYKSLYTQVIRPSMRRIGLRCERADDIFSAVAIVQDVWVSLNKARILIAEMTGRNPNVFYEIGLSHALRQPVILLSQERSDVPFDVRHIRRIFYNDTKSGRKRLASTLAKTARNVLR
jgi:hypothetical protein